jgi:tRNA threonylcarbamoyl adenosine modification protein (Sua5/YciO/YrdC/YwlC family)
MEFLKLTDSHLVDLLKNGGVGVLPTDTVYGLVCDAANGDAVAKLYTLKSREKKPGTLIAANANQVIDLGIQEDVVRAVEKFWPGVSVVMQANEHLAYIHQGLETLAVRVVADEDLKVFLEQTGPLLTSSANLPVDGGDLFGRQASTLIRVKDGIVEVLRQGSVKLPIVGM